MESFGGQDNRDLAEVTVGEHSVTQCLKLGGVNRPKTLTIFCGQGIDPWGTFGLIWSVGKRPHMKLVAGIKAWMPR